jgi:hypothetical protein
MKEITVGQDNKAKVSIDYPQKHERTKYIKKHQRQSPTLILVLIILVITVVCFVACTNVATEEPTTEEPITYKGLNGEDVENLGAYGASRIIEAENFEHKMNYNSTEIPCGLDNTKLFIIVIWSEEGILTGAEESVMIWSYVYMWNDSGIVDDTWTKQHVIKEL